MTTLLDRGKEVVALLVSGGVVRAWITINYLDSFYLRANRLFEGYSFE